MAGDPHRGPGPAEPFQGLPAAVMAGRLRSARSNAGLTRDAAASALDIARATLAAIEEGQRPVEADELVALASLYGLSVGRLTSPDAVHVDLAASLGDGESAAIALAAHRGLDVAIDDRKARRIIAARFPAVRAFWTVDLLRAPSVVASLGAARAADLFDRARRHGRMHVPQP